MPSPDGRSWLTSRKIGLQIMTFFIKEFKGEPWFDAETSWSYSWDMDAETFTVDVNGSFPDTCMLGQPNIKARFWNILREGYLATGYGTEFKILRLTEKLKNAIYTDQITDISVIKEAFNDIYTSDVLDQYDEEGDLIPSGSGG